MLVLLVDQKRPVLPCGRNVSNKGTPKTFLPRSSSGSLSEPKDDRISEACCGSEGFIPTSPSSPSVIEEVGC